MTIDPADAFILLSFLKTHDENAFGFIRDLAEKEGANLMDIARQSALCDSGEPDGLNAYLQAIYYGAPKSLTLLFQKGALTDSVSAFADDESTFLESKTLDARLSFAGANDITLAILSDKKTVLTDLLTLYDAAGIAPDINSRTIVPANMDELRDHDAQKHTPLDIAVMYYIAQKYQEEDIAQSNDAIARTLTQKITQETKKIQDVFKNAGRDPENINIGFDIIPNDDLIYNAFYEPTSSQMAENILTLIDRGAVGSDGAYFPASQESTRAPFYDDDQSAFQVISLREYCEEHQYMLSSALFKKLITARRSNTLAYGI